ncbi:hypothetical protein [Nostoc sp. FACHB-110]|uniref:hypothetical protein n=1 Tax=Nostoc sp. FACHB-110 TaxID=2692834 RepID=UPI001682EBCB|nr:hypothetical protein [Nostoc sp. FACHB-110]MBD2440977.1 hypothetical protein [Nostoc sp. FACHB-110]
MTVTSNTKLTIHFNDPVLEPEEKDQQVQWLIADLNDMDEIESVNRVLDLNPPDRSKSFRNFLAGLLMVEVNTGNAKKKLLPFLGNRLGGTPIELSVEFNGKKLTVTAQSREELEVAVKAIQDFIEV